MNVTLITGATGVLGKAFVKELQAEPLLLTGRSEDKLAVLKEELLKIDPHRPVYVFPARLDLEEDRNTFYSYIMENDLTFSKVVLVAGADIQKAFSSYTEEKLLFQLRTNLEANASILRFAYDRRGDGFSVLGISSVSGIYPMPYFAVYSATKGAFTSLLTSLHYEWNVPVSAVLPGAMPTREDIKENIKKQGLWGKLAVKSPEWVAKKSLIALKRNRVKYIPGFWNNVMNLGTKLIPMPLKLRFIASRWSKSEKDAF